MKALIKVGYACNEHCSFCHTQDVRDIQAASAEVETKIRRAAELGHTMVVLSGGEATIRPELGRWAALVSELGMDLGLVTNGLMLAYDDVLEMLLRHRLRYVYMSLHGGEASIHDRLVRRPSFGAARQAVDNLSGRGLDLTINCVVTRHNVDHLRGLVDAVSGVDDATLKFSMVEPKGGAWHLFDQLVVAVSEAAAKVVDAIEYGLRRYGSRGPRYTHGGFPLCLMAGLEDAYDDLRTHHFRTMIEVGEPDFFAVDDANKVQPEKACRDCSLRGPCPGLYRTYHDRHGSAELRPVHTGVRSNSFDWIFEELVETSDAPAATCVLLRTGVTPWDRGRTLFVRNEGRIGRFIADTRDFSDAQIEVIKHGVGQIYLDASRKPSPDDFASDLVKLRRVTDCDDCSERDRCTGMYEPVFEPVFDDDDQEVATLLESLRGRILDIGCGEGRYVEVLRRGVEEGRIEYQAVEPDAGAVEALRRRWPDVNVQRATLEEAELHGPFDHVLLLRSWNHLPDPGRALRTIVSVLEPGGSLTVVDNVAFGLARTRRQTARARAGPARFEHHRNDDAQQAHERIRPWPFRVTRRRDVTPERSNQWLLGYRLDTLTAR